MTNESRAEFGRPLRVARELNFCLLNVHDIPLPDLAWASCRRVLTLSVTAVCAVTYRAGGGVMPVQNVQDGAIEGPVVLCEI